MLSLHQTPIAALLDAPKASTSLFSYRISAGFPSPSEDHLEDGLDLNDYLIRHKSATFMFAVSGDSMTGVGILDGDKVVVDRAIRPQHGQIVVAVVRSEFTIKRLFKREERVELHAANPKYPPITFTEAGDLLIWGVVVGVVRRYPVAG